jgi:hypothetical protein
MNEGLLREFIKEAMLLELRRDDQFIDHLKRQSSFGAPRTPSAVAARQVASGWVQDMETELGQRLSPGNVTQVNKFVAKRWPGVLQRYRGDQAAALQTMHNLLDAKYSSLRMGD